MTDKELLDATKKCIHEILTTGQSVSTDGHMLTMANLRDLRELRDNLESRLASQHRRGRNRIVYVVPE